MKKVVLKVSLPDDKTKMRIMKKISCMPGIESISVDTKEQKLTVVGDIDPVSIVGQIRKFCQSEIVSVGPAKESDDRKKDVKADGQKKGEEKKKDMKKDVSELVNAYQAYTPEFKSYYYVKSEDENSSCTIC